MDSLQQHYMQKKNEMEKMMTKKTPDQIDFTIKEKDEPISNMEEMMQRYMKDRDLDVPKAPEIVPQSTTPAVSIQIIEDPIRPVPQPEPEQTKKSVSFLDQQILEQLIQIQSKLLNMEKDIQELKSYHHQKPEPSVNQEEAPQEPQEEYQEETPEEILNETPPEQEESPKDQIEDA
jgi:hypothetical protein